jgi:hypothetical protein
MFFCIKLMRSEESLATRWASTWPVKSSVGGDLKLCHLTSFVVSEDCRICRIDSFKKLFVPIELLGLRLV